MHVLVQIFVERCTKALIAMLEMGVISWPGASERRIISKHFQEKNVFSNGIGLVDKSVFPLGSKPTCVVKSTSNTMVDMPSKNQHVW
jgi:hypothetical protein